MTLVLIWVSTSFVLGPIVGKWIKRSNTVVYIHPTVGDY